MASITLKNIVKTYDNKVTVIPGLDLEIHDKEFIILVGPSGCGKSTTLRMIAGLEEITAGELYIGEKKVNNVAPKDRDIAMVFQNYALYPHMTVYKNMAFGLMLRKTPRAEIDRKVHEAAQLRNTSTASRAPSPAASGSVLHSAGPWCAIPLFFCLTSPSPTWMQSCAPRCAQKSSAYTSNWKPPLYMSRMIRQRQ